MRLSFVVIFTSRFEEMKAFYAKRIGLKEVPGHQNGWAEFDTGSARIGLHAMDDPERHGIALRFYTPSIDERVAAISGRGIEMQAPTADYPWGRFAEFTDTEDNPVGMLQPKGGAPPATGDGPVVDRVVVSCRDYQEAMHFWRERVGLKPTVENDHWTEFDTGDARLALHPRRRDSDHPPHSDQNITIVFGSTDLLAWVEEMRGRGIHFATAPIAEDFGLYAEAADPDGYMVVFREPPPPATLEDELIEAFEEDEDTPHIVAIRKPAQKPSRASDVIAGLKKRARREAAAERAARPAPPVAVKPAKKLDVVSPRGTGETGSRQKPKREHDPKRAKAKPAIGSLKEAERKTIVAKKRSVAGRSKSRPVKSAAKSVKRAVKKAVKRAVPKAVAKRVVKRAKKKRTAR
jgi:predicted enzyme related to lactoylglutathione lyase